MTVLCESRLAMAKHHAPTRSGLARRIEDDWLGATSSNSGGRNSAIQPSAAFHRLVENAVGVDAGCLLVDGCVG
jgi:hypothetical protein